MTTIYKRSNTALARASIKAFRVASLAILSLLNTASSACAQDNVSGQVQPDRWVAQVTEAEHLLTRGDRTGASVRAMQVVNAYQRDGARNSSEHTSAGRAWVLLGVGDASAVKSALRAFDQAVALDSGNIDALRRSAALLLDKFNAPDARATYDLALKRAPKDAATLLGIARVDDFEGKGTALATALASLAADPKRAETLAFIARLHMDAESFDSARVYAERAVSADSTELAGWGVLGAIAWVTGDSAEYKRALRAATSLEPAPSSFFLSLAEASVRQRRYSEAVELAKRAVHYDSLSTAAIGLLGTTQLRIGAMDEGRTNIERAFSLDPFNLWHKNTLDLLDKMKTFKTIRQGRFELVAPAGEAELLDLYLVPLLERAFDSLTVRYGYQPPTPIRLELFRQHADFSVRTVGLNGLGALGVSFGSLLAMDAPSARDKGAFNWGSTAWHELTHAFTLGASHHRVPRWFSEGLSVVEERRASRGWGAGATLPWMTAYKLGRVRPVSQLNDGFLMPRYPEETIFSYYQASLFCEWVETTRGIATIRAMLVAYKDGLETPEVFQKVLKLSPDQVDSQYDSWLKSRFSSELNALQGSGAKDSSGVTFVSTMRRAVDLSAAQADSARILFERARTMFPSYSGSDGPSWFLAKLALETHDTTKAIAMLSEVTSRNETAWDANILESELRESRGDRTGTMAVLERLNWIWPYDVSVHSRYAEQALANRDYASAIRERRAAIASKPSDMLAAKYELARALAAAGETGEARKELLQILEEAPGFEKAQVLLLELQKRMQGGVP